MSYLCLHLCGLISFQLYWSPEKLYLRPCLSGLKWMASDINQTNQTLTSNTLELVPKVHTKRGIHQNSSSLLTANNNLNESWLGHLCLRRQRSFNLNALPFHYWNRGNRGVLGSVRADAAIHKTLIQTRCLLIINKTRAEKNEQYWLMLGELFLLLNLNATQNCRQTWTVFV